MKITQLSVFAENKPGQLIAPCRTLAEAGVNIRALSLADTQRFGILRMIVSDPQQARKVLEDSGFLVKITEVVAIEVADRPGGMAEILSVLEASAVNIEYMYAFPFGHGENAIVIFRFDDPDSAIAKLQQAGINMVGKHEL
jgi:hypothetical protein